MLSKVLSSALVGRVSSVRAAKTTKVATKSPRSLSAVRRFTAAKESRRGYVSKSVAGGAATTIVEDKIVRERGLEVRKTDFRVNTI